MDGEAPKPRMSKLERAKQRLAALQAEADEKQARDLAYQEARSAIKHAYNLCGRHEWEKAIEAMHGAENILMALAGLTTE